MPTRRYEGLISCGLVQPLDTVPFHDLEKAPVLRRLMAGRTVLPETKRHIAVHEIRNAAWEDRDYCAPHWHECPEVNLLLSWEQLAFRIVLGDEIYTVEAPATIYIRPRLIHSANVIGGTGFFIAIVENSEYTSTFADPATTNAGPET
jgi:hypothetical protein